MSLQVLMVIHVLPLWFLIFALFLPRIALLVLWFETPLTYFHLHGIIPLLVLSLIHI